MFLHPYTEGSIDRPMRILSLRLMVALIIGVTLVSLASSWYQVQAEKDELRRDLGRKAETFGESFARLSDRLGKIVSKCCT
jgi:hypothetical protein